MQDLCPSPLSQLESVKLSVPEDDGKVLQHDPSHCTPYRTMSVHVQNNVLNFVFCLILEKL